MKAKYQIYHDGDTWKWIIKSYAWEMHSTQKLKNARAAGLSVSNVIKGLKTVEIAKVK